MERIPVDSSMLREVGYDPATMELEAEFNTGAVWRYKGVPPEVYRQLMTSGSKGSYMRDFVIGQYPETRIRRREGRG